MDNATAIEPTEQQQPKGALWRLQGILFQPKQTFEAINVKPNWLVPVVAILLVSSLGLFLLSTLVGLDNFAEQMTAQNPKAAEQMAQLPEDQREVALAVQKTMFVVFGLIGFPILGVIVSLAFLLAFWVAGSEARFGKIFSVVAHSFFAYGVINTVLSGLIMLLAQDPTQLDLLNMVPTHLGLLIDRIQSPVLFGFLSSLDLLSFYTLFLLTLGMSVVGRKSIATSAALVFILWALYVALFKVGLTALFT